MYESLKESVTPAEMRRAIEVGARHNPIIHMALTMARRDGLQEVDVYAQLAYFALQNLAQTQRNYIAMMNALPAPRIIGFDLAREG